MAVFFAQYRVQIKSESSGEPISTSLVRPDCEL